MDEGKHWLIYLGISLWKYIYALLTCFFCVERINIIYIYIIWVYQLLGVNFSWTRKVWLARNPELKLCWFLSQKFRVEMWCWSLFLVPPVWNLCLWFGWNLQQGGPLRSFFEWGEITQIYMAWNKWRTQMITARGPPCTNNLVAVRQTSIWRTHPRQGFSAAMAMPMFKGKTIPNHRLGGHKNPCL